MTNIKYKINGNRPVNLDSVSDLIKKFSYKMLGLIPSNKPKYVPIRSYEEMVKRESKMYKISKKEIILDDAYFENELRDQLNEINNKPLTKEVLKNAYYENELRNRCNELQKIIDGESLLRTEEEYKKLSNESYSSSIESYKNEDKNYAKKCKIKLEEKIKNNDLGKDLLRSRTKYETIKDKISMLNNSILDLGINYFTEMVPGFITDYEKDFFQGYLMGFINGEYFQHEIEFNDTKNVKTIAYAQNDSPLNQISNFPSFPSRINNILINRDVAYKIFNKHCDIYMDRHIHLLSEKSRREEKKEIEKERKLYQKVEEKSKHLVDKLLN